MTDYYTGVGSRQTPPLVMRDLRSLAAALSAAGIWLRSGGADGADTAFDNGAGPNKQIFLPWRGFNFRQSEWATVSPEAMEIASQVHPAWHILKDAARKLHSRNVYQVLGPDLKTPSKFLVCWTPDGCETETARTRQTGGTATAIVLAARNGIPVFNLQRDGRMRDLANYLRETLQLELPPALLAANSQLNSQSSLI